jgi:hypothetical protein
MLHDVGGENGEPPRSYRGGADKKRPRYRADAGARLVRLRDTTPSNHTAGASARGHSVEAGENGLPPIGRYAPAAPVARIFSLRSLRLRAGASSRQNVDWGPGQTGRPATMIDAEDRPVLLRAKAAECSDRARTARSSADKKALEEAAADFLKHARSIEVARAIARLGRR